MLTAHWEGAHSTPKQEDKQEDKQERTTPSAAKAAKAAKAAPSESDSWIAEFEKRWTSKFNAPCHFKSKASSKTIQELQAKGITAAEFCARTDRYLALDDAYIRNNGYSLHGFLAWRWNQLFVEGAGTEAVDPRTIKPKLAI